MAVNRAKLRTGDLDLNFLILEMTTHLTQKCFTAASGMTSGLFTPCQQHKFGAGVLNELFQKSLPTYLQQLQSNWSSIQSTRVSGLVPTSEGGPFDDCVRDGAWVPEIQAAHGGPIPFLACSEGSRGAVESWPYFQNQRANSWAQVGGHSHPGGNYQKVFFQQPTQSQQRWATFQEADCHDMDWTVGRPRQDNFSGSGLKRAKKKSPAASRERNSHQTLAPPQRESRAKAKAMQ